MHKLLPLALLLGIAFVLLSVIVGLLVGSSTEAPPDPSLAAVSQSDQNSPAALPPTPLVVPESGSPASVGPDQPKTVTKDLVQHLRDCEQGVSDWQPGQVDYPTSLEIKVGETATYVAAVDIRDVLQPPTEVVPDSSARSEPVAVKCEIAARLTPLGDALQADSTEWSVRTFTPNGFTRWAWLVKAAKAEDQSLRLELQPAITSAGGDVLVSDRSTNVGVFITRVHVTQSVGQAAGQWWDENWGKLSVIAAAIGAALVALVKWSGGFAESIRNLRRKSRAEQHADTDKGGNEDRKQQPTEIK